MKDMSFFALQLEVEFIGKSTFSVVSAMEEHRL